MSIINNLVREMLYNTFKDKDIDYFGIKAEEISSIRKKLLYNWSVANSRSQKIK